MSIRDFAPIFRFSSMAFVGASDGSHFGLGAFRAMTDVGFQGQYYPVNPKRETVHGVKAYASISAIPGPVDAVVIAVARPYVLSAFEEAVTKGARAVVVLSGNFAEADDEGRRLQLRLTELAAGSGTLLVGPNCMGAASVRHRCALYQGRGLKGAQTGGISVISQSGGLMHEFLQYGNARALGFCHLVSSGNEADANCAQMLDFYAADPDSEVIVLIVESVREPELFVAALERAAAAGKPVIAFRLGTSDKGAASALTHTGALAGDSTVWDALLKQKATIRAYDIDELVDLAALASHVRPLLRQGPLERAGVIEISGGSCELICDLAASAGLELPEPTASTVDAIKPKLQEFLSVRNPLDTGMLWTNPAMGSIYPPALEAFGSQADIDIVLSRFIVPSDLPLGTLNDRLQELEAARRAHPDKLFVTASPTSGPYHPEWKAALQRYSLPFIPGFSRVISALGKLAQYSRAIRGWEGTRSMSFVRHAATREVDTPVVLNEVASKQLLGQFGLRSVTTRLARSAVEAAAIAGEIGFPVAMKILSPQMTHKSDAGGVRLNVRAIAEVETTFADFAILASHVPGAVFEGVSVQNMAPLGLELLLGAHRDRQFGPVIVFGLGGIFVETLADMALKVAPLSNRDAVSMLTEIRASRLLESQRGRPAVDRAAIVQALLSLSRLMVERTDVQSVDVNPAFAYPDGLLTVDARIVVSAPAIATIPIGLEALA